MASKLAQAANQVINNKSKNETTGVLLLLQVPRTNEKKELAAEQMFAALHGLLIFPKTSILKPAERLKLSFEIAVRQKRIGFYVWVPIELKEFVEEQIYAQYPNVQISEVSDYALDPQNISRSHQTTEMTLSAKSALPIKTFQSFEVDPLAAITATLAKFNADEEAWIQLVVQPADEHWYRTSERYINSLNGRTQSGPANLISTLWKPPENTEPTVKKTDSDHTRASGAELKSQKLAYQATLRITYVGKGSSNKAKMRLQSIAASFKQFNTTYLNGFKPTNISSRDDGLNMYANRKLNTRNKMILNIEEVATLYHLPHTNVETPNIYWASSQTAEPPANLPVVTRKYDSSISPIALANFRAHNTLFGLPRLDRSRHLYILGQTGVGKSGMLELLTISDINSPYGFAVVDPHGDYALNILRRIPAERIKDVIYFNPADTDFPIAFNPMEVFDPKLKTQTASELVGVIKRMFDSWGPRLEYILRYSLLALLEYPDSTMLDITRILTDKKFRDDVLTYVDDPVVANFWKVEFTTWSERYASEAIAPVLNKIGAFTANPIVRNMIGQTNSSFSIRKIMDERKILIINLTRGLIGEDNAALLGALLVTKIQLAAMSRADIPSSERVPFYLYVDEFQNFATDSFATILSEARKYSLNLTVANQYVAQMSNEVKDAVFGNVGSMIAFRLGADDALSMRRYFEPKFTDYDLVHMHNRHFVINMTIDGEKSPAFSSISIDLPPYSTDHILEIVEHSRANYARPKHLVEKHINSQYETKPKISSPKISIKQPIVLSKPQTDPIDLAAIKNLQATVLKRVSVLTLTKHKRNRHRRRKNGTLPPANKEVTIYTKKKIAKV